MNYETIVHDLFLRFPQYQKIWNSRFKSKDEKRANQYDVFGSVLIKLL